MKLSIKDGLPFAEITLLHKDKRVLAKNVLVDTGSASTIISTEIAIALDLAPSPDDELFRIKGVGGSEYVYEKSIDKVILATATAHHFRIDAGAMNYGFDINAIIGMDFLLQTKVIINLDKTTIYPSQKS